ncbi:MAG: 50S ribosomal protein L15 [Patescibacteria group bacterium]|nr:50S ribosomal protein L15 [Patescibacteria group bacterium]
MQLHQLQRRTPNKGEKRVGRGGSRGKTSGRGTKGQKARAGHRIRPAVREELKKLPKLRGRGKNTLLSIQDKPMVVNVSTIERLFNVGDIVNPKVLVERGIVHQRRGEKIAVKILGDGELTKKITVAGCVVSASAREKIEKQGGNIQ